MLRYLTPRWPYNIQGPQTLAVAQISLTNYKQWDWGVVGTTHHQSCPLPRHWPPPLQSEPAETDTPSSFGSWLVLFLQAIVIHIYKEHFQEWKFSGGSARMFFKSKVALGVWIFLPFKDWILRFIYRSTKSAIEPRCMIKFLFWTFYFSSYGLLL